MKKFFLVAIAVAGAWGVFQANQNNNNMSELQMENAELLAQGESTSENVCCRWALFNYSCNVIGIYSDPYHHRCKSSCPYGCY